MLNRRNSAKIMNYMNVGFVTLLIVGAVIAGVVTFVLKPGSSKRPDTGMLGGSFINSSSHPVICVQSSLSLPFFHSHAVMNIISVLKSTKEK